MAAPGLPAQLLARLAARLHRSRCLEACLVLCTCPPLDALRSLDTARTCASLHPHASSSQPATSPALPAGLGPAPRLVPVVPADQRGSQRARPLQAGPHPRLRAGRQGCAEPCGAAWSCLQLPGACTCLACFSRAALPAQALRRAFIARRARRPPGPTQLCRPACGRNHAQQPAPAWHAARAEGRPPAPPAPPARPQA